MSAKHHFPSLYLSGSTPLLVETSNNFDNAALIANRKGEVSVSHHPLGVTNSPVSILNTTDISTSANADATLTSLNTLGGAVVAKNLVIRHGTNDFYFPATSKSENLRIVRANVRGSDGAVVEGAGVTCAVSTGAGYTYTLTFATPFTGTPSVTATCIDPAQTNQYPTLTAAILVPQVTSVSPTTCVIKFWSLDSGSGNINLFKSVAPIQFSLNAVGPGGSTVF